jgi:hypothetical protein
VSGAESVGGMSYQPKVSVPSGVLIPPPAADTRSTELLAMLAIRPQVHVASVTRTIRGLHHVHSFRAADDPDGSTQRIPFSEMGVYRRSDLLLNSVA